MLLLLFVCSVLSKSLMIWWLHYYICVEVELCMWTRFGFERACERTKINITGPQAKHIAIKEIVSRDEIITGRTYRMTDVEIDFIHINVSNKITYNQSNKCVSCNFRWQVGRLCRRNVAAITYWFCFWIFRMGKRY